jgi:hypothetical protein
MTWWLAYGGCNSQYTARQTLQYHTSPPPPPATDTLSYLGTCLAPKEGIAWMWSMRSEVCQSVLSLLTGTWRTRDSRTCHMISYDVSMISGDIIWYHTAYGVAATASAGVHCRPFGGGPRKKFARHSGNILKWGRLTASATVTCKGCDNMISRNEQWLNMHPPACNDEQRVYWP